MVVMILKWGFAMSEPGPPCEALVWNMLDELADQTESARCP